MSFLIYDIDCSEFIYETYCLESLTRRFRKYDHSICVIWQENVPEFIKETFSKFFNFRYEKGSSKIIFNPNTSDYIPSLVLRLIRDRNSYGLTNNIIKEGMESIINTLASNANFTKSYLFIDRQDMTEYTLPRELLFVAFLREMEKYDEMLKKYPEHSGFISAIYHLFNNSSVFKDSVKNVLLEYYSGKKIELITYDKRITWADYKDPYGKITVDVDYLLPFIYKTQEDY